MIQSSRVWTFFMFRYLEIAWIWLILPTEVDPVFSSVLFSGSWQKEKSVWTCLDCVQSEPCVSWYYGCWEIICIIILIILASVCLQFEPLERVVVDIPFLLMTDILSSSPWPLLLASSSLQLLTMSSNTPQAESQLQGGTWLVFTDFYF